MKSRCLPIVLAAALIAAPAGLASRAPTTAETRAITDAVTGFYDYWWYYELTKPVQGLEVTKLRVSTVDAHWAAAFVKGPAGRGRPKLAGSVLLYHGVSSWLVAEGVASEFIGRKIAPDAVNSDLFRGLGGC